MCLNALLRWVSGAGLQCGSPSFGPPFVPCPELVLPVSNDCPLPDYFLSLSCSWLLFVSKFQVLSSQNPVFVLIFLILSSFCPHLWPNSWKNHKTKTGHHIRAERGCLDQLHKCNVTLYCSKTGLSWLFTVWRQDSRGVVITFVGKWHSNNFATHELTDDK